MRGSCVWLLVALLAAPHSARADDEKIATFVESTLADGCSLAPSLDELLVLRSSKILLRPPTDAKARVSSRIVRRGAKFVGTFELTSGSSSTTRTLTASRCESLIGAMSLSIALLLDPEGARSDINPSPAPSPPPSLDPPPQTPSVPTPPEAQPSREAPPSPRTPSTGSRRLAAPGRWGLDLGLRSSASTAIRGWSGEMGGEIALERRVSNFVPSARLTLYGVMPRTVAGPGGVISLAGIGGRLAGCVATDGIQARAFGSRAALWIEPCVAITSRIFRVHATTAAIDLPSTRAIVAPSLVGRFGLRIGAVRFGAELEAGAPFSRERFRIDPEGEVFRLPALYVSAGGFANIRLL